MRKANIQWVCCLMDATACLRVLHPSCDCVERVLRLIRAMQDSSVNSVANRRFHALEILFVLQR